MLSAFDRNLVVLHQRIREAANHAPPEYRQSADANADLEEADIRERLWACETDAERERIVQGYLHIWGAA